MVVTFLCPTREVVHSSFIQQNKWYTLSLFSKTSGTLFLRVHQSHTATHQPTIHQSVTHNHSTSQLFHQSITHRHSMTQLFHQPVTQHLHNKGYKPPTLPVSCFGCTLCQTAVYPVLHMLPHVLLSAPCLFA